MRKKRELLQIIQFLTEVGKVMLGFLSRASTVFLIVTHFKKKLFYILTCFNPEQNQSRQNEVLIMMK